MITLGVDCGTQSTKTIAFDLETRKVVAEASRSYGLVVGLPQGHAEQHPSVWIQALDETIAEVLSILGERRKEVAAIGISGQQHGFVPLDSDKNVIRNAKLWCDTSTVEECKLFSDHFGGNQGLLRLTGLPVMPGFTAPKVLWLKRHEPENFARLAHILLPHDYLNYYLTGKIRMEFGDASGTALMNVRTREWSRELCSFIDRSLVEKLPPLTSSRGVLGEVRPELTKKWGIPSSSIVSMGGGDNMMGAIGTGNVANGCVTASLGTSGTIFAYSDSPIVDPDGEIAGFCDSTDAWLPLLCTMNVTVATEKVRQLFGWSHSEMENAVLKAPPGSEGLLFLPYLQGERTPNLPNATGSIQGLTTTNYTATNIARATMEGVTLGMSYGLGKMRGLGMIPKEIRLTGGGSKSLAWRQMCADIFGEPVSVLDNPEGAALGAAIQAVSAVRPEKTIAQWSQELVELKTGETVQPDSSRHDLYCELQLKQSTLTQCLVESSFYEKLF